VPDASLSLGAGNVQLSETSRTVAEVSQIISHNSQQDFILIRERKESPVVFAGRSHRMLRTVNFVASVFDGRVPTSAEVSKNHLSEIHNRNLFLIHERKKFCSVCQKVPLDA
jgi:hypothetical protein